MHLEVTIQMLVLESKSRRAWGTGSSPVQAVESTRASEAVHLYYHTPA